MSLSARSREFSLLTRLPSPSPAATRGVPREMREKRAHERKTERGNTSKPLLANQRGRGRGWSVGVLRSCLPLRHCCKMIHCRRQRKRSWRLAFGDGRDIHESRKQGSETPFLPSPCLGEVQRTQTQQWTAMRRREKRERKKRQTQWQGMRGGPRGRDD